MAAIVASLRNLESFYGRLDKKVQAVHTDLDRKMDRIACKQAERFEHIEGLLQEHEHKLVTCKERLSTYEDRLEKVENELHNAEISELKSSIRELQSRLSSMEGNMCKDTS